MKIFDVASEAPTLEMVRDELSVKSGVVIFRNAYSDLGLLRQVEQIFYQRLKQQDGSADHFSAGSNQRLWNSVNKLAEDAPELFGLYYGNPWLHLACEAWLGPLYQITGQVNVVVPGGAAQTGHRDYHLGFFPRELVEKMPPAIQQASQWLTLQGAIVHCDVPLEMGPTKFIPGSQVEEDGYLNYRSMEQQLRFEKQAQQTPLKMGDLVFFNPAIFHAAGSNRTKTPRLVNLLQVSSGLAKPMESLDFSGLVEQIYPHLSALDEKTANYVARVITDCYPFPSNLDLDPPTADWLGQLDCHWLLEQLRHHVNNDVVLKTYKERLGRRRY